MGKSRIAKPRLVFMPSMGDLFHEQVPDAVVQRVILRCLCAAKQVPHVFLLLTKRPERMVEALMLGEPNPAIWAGTTCENGARAVERLPYLARLKAAGWKTFVSCEPWLETGGPPVWLLDLPQSVDWVILGGETGPGARKIGSAIRIVAEAEHHGIPVFIKQMGAVWDKAFAKEHGRKPTFEDWPEWARIRQVPAELQRFFPGGER